MRFSSESRFIWKIYRQQCKSSGRMMHALIEACIHCIVHTEKCSVFHRWIYHHWEQYNTNGFESLNNSFDFIILLILSVSILVSTVRAGSVNLDVKLLYIYIYIVQSRANKMAHELLNLWFIEQCIHSMKTRRKMWDSLCGDQKWQ